MSVSRHATASTAAGFKRELGESKVTTTAVSGCKCKQLAADGGMRGGMSRTNLPLHHLPLAPLPASLAWTMAKLENPSLRKQPTASYDGSPSFEGVGPAPPPPPPLPPVNRKEFSISVLTTGRPLNSACSHSRKQLTDALGAVGILSASFDLEASLRAVSLPFPLSRALIIPPLQRRSRSCANAPPDGGRLMAEPAGGVRLPKSA